MKQLRKKATPLDKYIHMHTIQDSDENLFYAMLVGHTQETMPFVYTPTVGQACQEWSHIYRHTPRGLYISLKDKGHIREALDNYPNQDIDVIVFTDGERILGLGDQGANGMGIPIGKLALYTACAGIHPAKCLPVHIDVGTNRQELLEDPAYMGLKQPRDRSEAYDLLIEEFFEQCQAKYGPNVLLQFEDFGNQNAFRLLERYRQRANCFNDDIQGTAAVVLAGLIASLPLTNKQNLDQHTYLFYGAGEAGLGIAELLASAIQQQTKCTIEEARQRCWFVDSKGLLSSSRSDKLEAHKKPFAHDVNSLIQGAAVTAAAPPSLLESVKLLKPTALVGVSAQGGAFTEEVCKEMARNCEHPLILPLSNPTSKAECVPRDAYTWTNGKCVLFSGSPFDAVTLPDGRSFLPGQGNNAYIFPGVGLGSLVAGATSLTDQDFYVAAAALAEKVSAARLAQGCCFPPLDDIRSVSAYIAAKVAVNVIDSGRSSKYRPGAYPAQDMQEHCLQLMYVPSYDGDSK
eukprot:CAMPEP_0170088140 /NCGR_PEP_ID=MMETSP0019_2-20121128/22464_1 /TAXON_ID=98059 /ORGANISM="Dinobryon sp., Strain UTEXLB2267" /LENGTH=515 /DNA_ID=CAMNT_0010306185 /DNA_START=167 /DNA_END=1714 /DNA_ORIENTATION=+